MPISMLLMAMAFSMVAVGALVLAALLLALSWVWANS
jgi:hypothetical protein